MSLIKQNNKYPTYKPFQYPWAYEYFREHQKMHWLEDEVPLADDVKDFNQGCVDEREYITNILRLFVQNDVMVGAGYDVMLRIFKPTEVTMMLREFAARENTHVSAYALLVETLGFDDSFYTEFLDIPEMEGKVEALEKAKVHKYEEYKSLGLSDVGVDKVFRRAVARMLAVYATMTEGISLFAQFAMLLGFQTQNKYKGMCTIVDWSIKDEEQHVQGNSRLFKEFIKENLDIWDDQLKYDIYEATRETVAREQQMVDYLYSKIGDYQPPVSSDDIKKYVEFIADERLKLIGLKPNWKHTNNPLPFMEELLNNVTLTNFFEGRSVEYAKGALRGEWKELR